MRPSPSTGRPWKSSPTFADAHYNLGNALAERGQIDEAIAHYRKALEIKPDFAEAHNNLASALTRRGRVDEAIAQYRKALEIKPDYAEAHYNLGDALHGEDGSTRPSPVPEGPENQPRLRRGPLQPWQRLASRGRLDEAIVELPEGPGRSSPTTRQARGNLAIALSAAGRRSQGVGPAA